MNKPAATAIVILVIGITAPGRAQQPMSPAEIPIEAFAQLLVMQGADWTRHMGLEDENAKVVSPYHQAERIKIPMLVIQAKDDANVHLNQGQGMAERLRKPNKPVEYVEVDLGGHSMDNEAARHTILQSLETFLTASLRPN